MKYKIKFLPSANRDIASLAEILEPHPGKAGRLFREMERNLKLLEEYPFTWSVYHANPKYRRMSLEGHALFYIVDEDNREVGIYRVLYAKRDIFKLLGG